MDEFFTILAVMIFFTLTASQIESLSRGVLAGAVVIGLGYAALFLIAIHSTYSAFLFKLAEGLLVIGLCVVGWCCVVAFFSFLENRTKSTRFGILVTWLILQFKAICIGFPLTVPVFAAVFFPIAQFYSRPAPGYVILSSAILALTIIYLPLSTRVLLTLVLSSDKKNELKSKNFVTRFFVNAA